MSECVNHFGGPWWLVPAFLVAVAWHRWSLRKVGRPTTPKTERKQK